LGSAAPQALRLSKSGLEHSEEQKRHGLDARGPVLQKPGRFRDGCAEKQDDLDVSHQKQENFGSLGGFILRLRRYAAPLNQLETAGRVQSW
jgi:hypothetical protein